MVQSERKQTRSTVLSFPCQSLKMDTKLFNDSSRALGPHSKYLYHLISAFLEVLIKKGHPMTRVTNENTSVFETSEYTLVISRVCPFTESQNLQEL